VVPDEVEELELLLEELELLEEVELELLVEEVELVLEEELELPVEEVELVLEEELELPVDEVELVLEEELELPVEEVELVLEEELELPVEEVELVLEEEELELVLLLLLEPPGSSPVAPGWVHPTTLPQLPMSGTTGWKIEKCVVSVAICLASTTVDGRME
jgi:hypothetical protein